MYQLIQGDDLSHYKHAFRALESALENMERLDASLFHVMIQAASRENAALYVRAAMDCLEFAYQHIMKITPLQSRAE